MTTITTRSGLRIVDNDLLVANVIAQCLAAETGSDQGPDSPFLFAIDSLIVSDETAISVELFGGVHSYLQSPECFGHPVMFYGWSHRIRAAGELIEDKSDRNLVERSFLQKLAALHSGNLHAFLLELPFESLDWNAWEGKTLEWHDGREIAIASFLPSLTHDLGNWRKRLESEPDVPSDVLVKPVKSVLLRLETYTHFLCDEEKKLLDSALFPDGKKWSEVILPADVIPVINALGRICASIQVTTK